MRLCGVGWTTKHEGSLGGRWISGEPPRGGSRPNPAFSPLLWQHKELQSYSIHISHPWDVVFVTQEVLYTRPDCELVYLSLMLLLGLTLKPWECIQKTGPAYQILSVRPYLRGLAGLGRAGVTKLAALPLLQHCIHCTWVALIVYRWDGSSCSKVTPGVYSLDGLQLSHISYYVTLDQHNSLWHFSAFLVMYPPWEDSPPRYFKWGPKHWTLTIAKIWGKNGV